jgi:hypothetical protein
MAVVGRRRAPWSRRMRAGCDVRQDSRAMSGCLRRRAARAFSHGGKPSNSGSTVGSGRYAVTTRPFQPLPRSFAWCTSGSSGDSVVAMTSMLKRSNNARGRNSGLVRQSLIRSKKRSADSGVRCSRTPNTSLAVEHPETVMIRRDEERGRVGEGLVVGVPLRIGVTVRADDRQPARSSHSVRDWSPAAPGQRKTDGRDAAKWGQLESSDLLDR